jgi:transcriptional regulator with GAF, ATPase, and Fis domain
MTGVDPREADAVVTDREKEVTEAFVSLAGALATGYDPVDLLNTLTSKCAELLDVASAGLLLADGRGVLHVLAASSENTLHLETFQVQRDEGPCLECYKTGAAVLAPNLEMDQDRWPQFVAAARAAGFASVHALPLRLRETTLGAMGLFGTSVGSLNEEDLRLGQALADVASVALVQDRAATDRATIVEQLQGALTSRVVIEQAKGVLSQQGRLDMGEAFAALRKYSRDRNLRLGEVAATVVSRALRAEEVLDATAAKDHTRRA